MSNPLVFSDIILVIGTFISFLLLFYLVFTKSNRNRANVFLFIITLGSSLFVFPRFLHRTGLLEQFPHLFGTARLFGFLLGPAMYFYVRSCIEKKINWQKAVLALLIIAIIDITLNASFLFKSGAEKMIIFNNYLVTGNTGQPLWLPIAKIICTTIFFVLSVRLAIRYRQHLDNTTSYIDSIYHRWLIIFCVICILPFITYATFVFTGFGIITLPGVSIGIYTYLFIIFLFVLFKPEIFYAFPHQITEPEISQAEKKKYEQSSLDQKRKGQYLQTLLQFMESEKPFQQPDLTINQLSEQINIPYYYVSQIINEKLDSNFIDFINKYRIEAAKKMLISKKYEQYTIVAIAYEAGFNSKSAFYSAFKRITNTTPSKFRKQLITN